MPRHLTLLATFGVGLTAGVLAGCQTYDFEPVDPLAVAQDNDTELVVSRPPKPNLMILIDKSASMSGLIDPGCTCASPPCTEAECPTRISDLREAMNTFLTSESATVARMGLALYPEPTDGALTTTNQCRASTGLRVSLSDSKDLDAELRAKATEINAQIQQLTRDSSASIDRRVFGGTPTGASLALVGGLPALNEGDERADFVLLLTDGLPNCNANNPQGPDAGCVCTQASCPTTESCLDRNATVAAIEALRGRNIKTIVVGFGAETASGEGPATLNAMARAGGFPRECEDNGDVDCGGAAGSCDQASGVCTTAFFQAANGAELAEALAEIGRDIYPPETCQRFLSFAPSDPALLSVSVGGARLARSDDTWQYGVSDQGRPTITLLGAQCEKLRASTSLNPVSLEIRVVKAL